MSELLPVLLTSSRCSFRMRRQRISLLLLLLVSRTSSSTHAFRGRVQQCDSYCWLRRRASSASTATAKSADGLEERYAAIAAAQSRQQAKYEAWVASPDECGFIGTDLVGAAASLGLALDLPTGTINYASDFEDKRLRLSFDLLYVRHGKTTGNTEPRVYQGNVDEPSNALNGVGLQQAQDAADLLDAQLASGVTTLPALVILSPLARAYDTGVAFLCRHSRELSSITEVWPEAREMAFGSWDNELVAHLPDDSIAHLFYLSQNVSSSFCLALNPHESHRARRHNRSSLKYVAYCCMFASTFTLTALRIPPPPHHHHHNYQAVVRASEAYVPASDPRRLEDGNPSPDAPSAMVPAENFVEVLQRMHKVLLKIDARMADIHVKGDESPLVLMYGHSMAGAALGILTGNGKRVDGADPPCLGFDGGYILPNAQPVLLYTAKAG
jgi:hypothetical protein